MSTAHKSDEKQMPSLRSRYRTFIQKKVASIKKDVESIMYHTIEGDTFSDAYKQARQKGLKTFVWAKTGQKYSTEYAGSPEEQMEKYGIVNDQLFARCWWQERLADNLYPVGYDSPFMRLWTAIVLNKNDDRGTDYSSRIGYSRMDYYNIYMGRPQKHNTLGISDYAPANVGEINGKKMPKPGQTIYKDNALSQNIAKYWAIYAKHLLNESNHKESRFTHLDMGRFKMALGHDEQGDYICYHDTWNMAPLGPTTDFGKPFEVYDRIYFDIKQVDKAFEEQSLQTSPDWVIAFREDSDGKNGEREHWEKDFITQRTRIIKVTKDGNWHSIVRDVHGKIVETVERRTDANHRVCSEIHRNRNGEILEEYEYIRNDEGRAIKKIHKDRAGHEREYLYDENAEIIGEIHRFQGQVIDGFGELYIKALQEQNQQAQEKRQDSSRSQSHRQYGNGQGIDDKLGMSVAMTRKKQKHLTTVSKKRGVHAA